MTEDRKEENIESFDCAPPFAKATEGRQDRSCEGRQVDAMNVSD